MIVLDASVVVDLLLNTELVANAIADRVARESPALSAPYLLDAEVGQVLRRYALRREITPTRATAALRDLLTLPINRYEHAPLLERAFDLYENVTFYDALYLALAEGLDAPLLTRDQALAQVPRTHAIVDVI